MMQRKDTKDTILEHVLVPEHEIAEEAAVVELLKRYKIEKEQLPKIKSTDPVIKEIKAKVGDVVRIKRSSRTAGECLFYRLVIA